MSDRALVLIIEDNPRNLNLARDILNHKGYETLEAETRRGPWSAPGPAAMA